MVGEKTATIELLHNEQQGGCINSTDTRGGVAQGNEECGPVLLNRNGRGQVTLARQSNGPPHCQYRHWARPYAISSWERQLSLVCPFGVDEWQLGDCQLPNGISHLPVETPGSCHWCQLYVCVCVYPLSRICSLLSPRKKETVRTLSLLSPLIYT